MERVIQVESEESFCLGAEFSAANDLILGSVEARSRLEA